MVSLPEIQLFCRFRLYISRNKRVYFWTEYRRLQRDGILPAQAGVFLGYSCCSSVSFNFTCTRRGVPKYWKSSINFNFTRICGGVSESSQLPQSYLEFYSHLRVCFCLITPFPKFFYFIRTCECVPENEKKLKT